MISKEDFHYISRANKRGVKTKKGTIVMDDFVSSTGRDLCIFLERLEDGKQCSRYFKFANYRNKDEAFVEAINDFLNVL